MSNYSHHREDNTSKDTAFERQYVRTMARCCRQAASSRLRMESVLSNLRRLSRIMATPRTFDPSAPTIKADASLMLPKDDVSDDFAIQCLSETGMWMYARRCFAQPPWSNGSDDHYQSVKMSMRERWGDMAVNQTNKPRLKSIAINRGEDQYFVENQSRPGVKDRRLSQNIGRRFSTLARQSFSLRRRTSMSLSSHGLTSQQKIYGGSAMENE